MVKHCGITRSLKGALYIATCLTYALGIAPAYAGSGPAGEVESNQAVVVSGTVLENRKGCERDGICMLRVREGKQVWRVIYHYGEGERLCVRNDITSVGLASKVGDTVTARGTEAPGTQTEPGLDVCESKSAYLQIVRRR